MKDNMIKKIAVNAAVGVAFAALSAFSAFTAKAGSSNFYIDDTGVAHIVTAQGVPELKEAMDGCTTFMFSIKLEKDIDISKISYTPSTTPFTGTFDGQGHTISGMTISVTSGNGLGFFKQISGATIKNVTFANATINKGITTGTAVGVVAGYATGSCTFENVHVTGSSVSANADIGGLVGWAKESAKGNPDAKVTVKDCSIESTKLQGLLCVAGFCGFVQGTCDISGSSLKDVTPTMNGTIVKLDTKNTCDGTATTCPGKGTVVKGRYMLYSTAYYCAAYADLYTTAGDSSHNCSLALGDGYPLIYSEIVHDAPYEVDGVLYSDKDEIPSVAKVGDTEYATLEEALAALSAENHTLTLLNDEAWDATTPVYWTAGTKSGYAATFADALTAAYKANAGDITIVCRPNADVGALTHGHVADNLTVYGNNAYLSAGECDLEIDTYKYSRTTGAQSDDGAYLEQDIAITAYELDNLGVWGQRNTSYTATINLTDCDGKAIDEQTNVQRVYLSGQTGANNITLTDCDFLTAATAVYSNADGAIVVENCTFTGGQAPVNINHKMDGAVTVSVEGCTFTDCGDTGDYAKFAAPIRFVNSGSGTMSASVADTTITGTVGANGDILLGDGRTGQTSNDVSLTVTGTAATVQVQKPGYYGSDGTTDATKAATETVTTDAKLETSIEELLPTVTEIDLDTFIKAVVEADYTFDGSTHPLAKDGVLTVKWSPVSGCFDTRDTHTCTVNDVDATGNTPNRVNSHLAQFQLFEKITSAVSVKNVAFVYEPADFTICANSGWKGSCTAEDVRAGQLYLMNTGDVTFESCSFDKVVLTSFNCGETSTVTNCSFKNVYNSYAVKDIRGETVSVTDCTFENCGAAIMVSATNATVAVNEVIISGNTFNKVDVSGTAPESDDPDENKVGTRGIIQIASSGDYSETTFDFSNNTATNCGPVMRQLNTTVALDAEDKTNLTKLVTGDSSLYTSDSLRAAKIGDVEYDTLEAALADVAEGKPLTYVAEFAWPESTPVYYNGKFYAATDTKGALELAIDAANEANSDDVAKIYVRPGFTADELVLQAHQNLKTSLAIYGNDAQLSGGWEPCIEYEGTGYHTLTKDVSISIYNLHKGAGVWGARVTDYTVDVTLVDCQDVHEVLINGSKAPESVNNYTIKNCTFDGQSTAGSVPVASTSAGSIVIEGCTFANLNSNYVINPNNQNGGAMEVIVKNTSFTNCGTSSKAVIRVAGEKEGTSATVTLDSLTFDESSAKNAIGIGKKELAENNADITYTITNTSGTLSVFEKGGTDETITATTTTLVDTKTYAGSNMPAAQIGETLYYSLADAFAEVQPGQTVTLLADVTETDEANANIAYNLTGVTFDLNGHTYSQNESAHVFYGTGGVIKNGTMVCLNDGSSALSVGSSGGATTSFTVEDVTMTGGISVGSATGVVLQDLTVTGTDASAVEVSASSSVTIKSGTYTAGAVAVLDGAATTPTPLTIEGGAFTAGDKSLVGTGGVVPSISGGKFDTDIKGSDYLASGLTTLYSTSESLYVVAPEDSQLVTVNATTEAGTTVTKTLHIAFAEAVVKKALEKAEVENPESATDAQKTEALSAKDTNGNPAWVNIVAGIDSEKSVGVDAAQNDKTATINVTPVNVETGTTADAGVQIAYQVDEVKVAASGTGLATDEVKKAGEVVSDPAIDVDNVETSAYFQVKLLVRQNGSTLATVPATNYVGVLKKSTKMTKAIVPVPWHSLADGGNISVSNVVKTANLTAGDKLNVYDAAEKKYNVYTLKADKTWEPAAIYKIDAKGQVSTETSGKPQTTLIPRGSGVWLERADTSTPIVTYGLVSATKQTTEIAAATTAGDDGTTTPTWSLAAVPSTESVALTELAAPANAENDTVIVPTEGAPRIYTVKDGKWGYNESVPVTDANGKVLGVRPTRKTDETLPAGTGFWYVNGGDAKSVAW